MRALLDLRLPAGRAALALAVALLGACAAPPERPPTPPPGAEAEARELLAAGRPGEAAAAYLRLAERGGERAPGYRLKAAAALLDAGETGRAAALLEALEGAALGAPERALATLLRAELALRDGRSEEALARLTPELGAGLGGEAARRFHALRARALEEAGNPVEAARERVALEALLADPIERSRNRQAIWSDLTRLQPAALERALRGAAPPALAGWLELASIAARAVTHPETLERELAAWRARYPGHPADAEVVPQLTFTSAEQAVPVRRVALLLPLGGRFEQAARAVRDGFLGAWYADPRAEERPAVRVHDTTGEDPWVSYSAALEDGADLVVGPLRREAVDALAGSSNRTRPVLALNRGEVAVARDDAAPLYEFALDPEEEARALAERAWFDGRARALLLRPRGEWGERVAAAFSEAFERLGGEVLEQAVYDPQADDMSAPVAAGLGVVASRERRRALSRQLGVRLGFEPRRRQDIDFVMLAAFPRQARQIRPQIAFQQGADLPVYATSHVFSGVIDEAADRDLDGIVFGDMPWVLPGAASPEIAALRERMSAAWPAARSGFARLYAFGVDAYRLIRHLGRLRAQRFAELEGASGRLSVSADGRIARRLLWARFSGGRPRLLDAPAGAP